MTTVEHSSNICTIFSIKLSLNGARRKIRKDGRERNGYCIKNETSRVDFHELLMLMG